MKKLFLFIFIGLGIFLTQHKTFADTWVASLDNCPDLSSSTQCTVTSFPENVTAISIPWAGSGNPPDMSFYNYIGNNTPTVDWTDVTAGHDYYGFQYTSGFHAFIPGGNNTHGGSPGTDMVYPTSTILLSSVFNTLFIASYVSISDVTCYNGITIVSCNTAPPNIANTGFINFVYPTTTSTTIPEFNNFALKAYDLNYSQNYFVQVHSLYFSDPARTNLQCAGNSQYPNQIIGTSTQYLLDPKILCFGKNYPNQTSTFVTSNAYLYTSLSSPYIASDRVQYPIFTAVGTSTYNTVSFDSGNNLVLATTTSPIQISTTTSQAFCQSTGDPLNIGTDIAFGLCVFSVGALTPLGPATSYLNDSVNSFESAPPFSGVFQTYSQLQSQIGNVPSSSPELDYNLDLGMASGSIPYLTSSTLATAVTPNGKIFLFSLEDNVFNLLDLGLIFFVPWHWWRKKHASKPI